MSKRLFSVLVAGAMIASVFSALPAQAAAQIPAVVQIDDPAGDANTMSGDMVTPAGNASNVGDLRKIWFSNTAETISVHIQTTLPPPAGAGGLLYTVLAAPGEGPVSTQAVGCLQFRVYVPGGTSGGTYQGKTWAKLHDRCNEGSNWIENGVEGEAVTETLEDKTGVTTLTYPRSYSPLLASGSVISGPTARSDALVGTDAVFLPSTPVTKTSHPWASFRYDDTKVGTDYTVSGGGSAEPPATEEPPAEEPEEKPKKNCKKKKGKAKKKCKKAAGEAPGGEAPGQACPAYVPGEAGAEAESVTVTDEATEEAPLEVAVPTGPGLGAGRNPGGLGAFVSHAYRNIQVDTSGTEAGLWIRVESNEIADYDLYLDRADGSNVAAAGGYAIEQDGDESDSHTEPGAETLTGIKTADCGGYTLDIVGAATAGGSVTLKVWLGEALFTPAESEGKRISQF